MRISSPKVEKMNQGDISYEIQPKGNFWLSPCKAPVEMDKEGERKNRREEKANGISGKSGKMHVSLCAKCNFISLWHPLRWNSIPSTLHLKREITSEEVT